MNLWIFFAGLVVLETLADVYAKKFGTDAKVKFFLVSLTLYALANASWLMSMHQGMQLWRGVVLFGILQALTGVVVGILMGETINSRQWVGIGVGIAAIVILLYEPHE